MARGKVGYLALMLFLLTAAVYVWVYRPSAITGQAAGVNITTSNITLTATVNNQAPSAMLISNETVYGPCAMGSTCAVGDRAAWWFQVRCVDENGYADISNVNLTIYNTTDTYNGGTATADDHKRYFNTSCTKTQINATAAWFNCTVFPIWYARKGGWTANATCNDSSSALNFITSTFTVDPIVGIGTAPATAGTVAFGSINPGASSVGKVVNVSNRGNDQLDLKIAGADFCVVGCTSVMLANNVTVKYASAATGVPNADSWDLNRTGTGTPAFNASDDISWQTSTTPVNRSFHLVLAIPMGQNLGSYTGYFNVTAQSG